MTYSLEQLSAALARQEDERAIERLVFRYGPALDFGTPDDYAALFTRDATLVIRSALKHVLNDDRPFPAAALLLGRGAEDTAEGYVFRGEAALRRFVTRERTARSLHVATQALVTLIGADTAESQSYLRIYNHTPGDSPQLVGFGRYLDRFARTDAGWRISHRICEL